MSQIDQVGHFIREVVALPCPAVPTMMGPERVEWFGHAIREELKEFEDATTILDQVDAVGDLAYFALGRLFELGVDPAAHFTAIHEANMRKRRGNMAKRPGSMGHDAVKPADWYGPDHEHQRLIEQSTRTGNRRQGAICLPDLSSRPATVDDLFAHDPRMDDLHYIPAEQVDPTAVQPSTPFKVLLLGHARHGKDTIAELLRDRHGFSFQSSSMFAAKRIIMPHFALAGSPYGDVESCYEDRVNHRALWYDLICAYNQEDPARLARELFETSDVYVGLRAAAEFKAVDAGRLFDLCIWVDRSDHIGPEDASSCTVAPHMADVILDNNGTLEETAANLASVLHGFRR